MKTTPTLLLLASGLALAGCSTTLNGEAAQDAPAAVLYAQLDQQRITQSIDELVASVALSPDEDRVPDP